MDLIVSSSEIFELPESITIGSVFERKRLTYKGFGARNGGVRVGRDQVFWMRPRNYTDENSL